MLYPLLHPRKNIDLKTPLRFLDFSTKSSSMKLFLCQIHLELSSLQTIYTSTSYLLVNASLVFSFNYIYRYFSCVYVCVLYSCHAEEIKEGHQTPDTGVR